MASSLSCSDFPVPPSTSPEKTDSKSWHEVGDCALSGPLLDMHSQPNTRSQLLCLEALHLPVSGAPTSPVSLGTGPPRPEGQREGHCQQIILQNSISLGFWGNSGGHMFGGVARPWQGEEGERAVLRVSCRVDALGGLPGDSWLLGISWLHWCVLGGPPQAVSMIWVWAWGQGLGGTKGS